MTQQHDGEQPQDPDPTGVRELLAGLRDRGSMPHDVSARIRARLAEEQRARAGEGAPAEGDPGAAVPFVRPARRPSRAARWIGGLAAAAAVVLGGSVAVQQLTVGGDSDSAGAPVAEQEAGSASTRADDEAADGSASTSSAPSATATTSSPTSTAPGVASGSTTTTTSDGELGTLVRHRSGHDYTASEVQAYVDGDRSSLAPTGAELVAGDETPCLGRGEATVGEAVILDDGSYDGRPAILVARDVESSRTRSVQVYDRESCEPVAIVEGPLPR